MNDDELGTLLKETFADKEVLLDESLPVATRRRRAPVLLAAAAIVVVLGGVLYGVHRPDGSPAPAATVKVPHRTGTDDAQIWAAALNRLLPSVVPGGGWRGLIVLDPSGAGYQAQRKGPKLSPPQLELLTKLVTPAPLSYSGEVPPAPSTCADPRTGVAQIFDVVDKGDHSEVEVNLTYSCNHRVSVKYRVEKRDGRWVVTKTLERRTTTR